MTNKLDDLASYDQVKDKVEHYQDLVGSKEMETETFIRTVSALLNSG